MLKDEVAPVLQDERARLQQIGRRLVKQCWDELEQKSQGRFITHTVVFRGAGNELRINWAKQWARPGKKASQYNKQVLELNVKKKPYYSRRDIPNCPDWIWEVAEKYEAKFTLIRKQNRMIGEFGQFFGWLSKLYVRWRVRRMDDLESRAARSMPKRIREKLVQSTDLLPQLAQLSDRELRSMSVTITALVDHVMLMDDKPRQNARKQGEKIHAQVEKDTMGSQKHDRGTARTPLCAIR
ncbi:MAG: conjugative transfer protein MobI(A/C) [Porticoccaceae bacterium]